MQTRSSLRRRALIPPPPSPCNADAFDVGTFYEIDHSKLPQKSPVQLRALRVVKVSGRTKLKTNVKFPSLVSLRNYFSAKLTGADGIPELDEELTMSYDCARRSLRRKIPNSQLDAEKRLRSFWLVDPSAIPAIGCLVGVRSSRVPDWGVQRRVDNVVPHQDTPRRRSAVKKRNVFVEVNSEERAIALPRDTPQRRSGSVAKKDLDVDRTLIGRKRTRGACRKGKGKKRRNVNVEVSSEERLVPRKGSTGRWSKNRYRSAELKLVETIREKGAEIGRPILRQELREEARKHVRDTGLLDHLLKHIDRKVVARGGERIRRRHNAEGTLEYWLEPAELTEIRETAGVDAECKKETSRLREERVILEREKKQLEKERADAQTALAAAAAGHNHGACCRDWQVKHEKLVEWNARMEAEMGAFTSCVEGLKEQLKILKEKKNATENKCHHFSFFSLL